MNIKTKHNIGEACKITGVDVQVLGTSKPFVQYRFCVFPPVKEEHVFKSKEELIKYIEK